MCLTIDPRDFVSPPYVRCPKCGRDSFGVLTIDPGHYSRRCKNCLYPNPPDRPVIIPLPKLRKEVIYVDQFAVSNMMKALNPSTKAHTKSTLDPFWRSLFEQLDSLCKLQLIVCPQSDFHRNESLVSPYHEPLRRMYELLCGEVHFRAHEDIKIAQICEHAKKWAHGESLEESSLSADVALDGNLNGWTDTIIISVKRDWSIDWADQLRKDRERVCKGLNGAVEKWKQEKNKDFQDWFSAEASGYGNLVLRDYNARVERMANIRQGRTRATLDDLNAPYALSFSLVESLKFTFQQAGVDQERIQPSVVKYLQSASFEDIPFIRVSAMLFAAVARQFAHGGRRNPITQGLATDIEIISVLLPYCDAAFIDNECAAYLRDRPLCDLWDYKTKVFSLNKRADFLEYLVAIRQRATKQHLAKVEEVYGLNAEEPYTTLYFDE